jgi:fructose-bisphosphate aldolase, class II
LIRVRGAHQCVSNPGGRRYSLRSADTQFAYLAGIRDFIKSKEGYLQTQVGNPEGADKPNKKYYDPRVWVREGEKTLTVRVKKACEDLGNVGE